MAPFQDYPETIPKITGAGNCVVLLNARRFLQASIVLDTRTAIFYCTARSATRRTCAAVSRNHETLWRHHRHISLTRAQPGQTGCTDVPAARARPLSAPCRPTQTKSPVFTRKSTGVCSSTTHSSPALDSAAIYRGAYNVNPPPSNRSDTV